MPNFASLDRCKRRCKITGTDDDDDLKGIMAAATSALLGHVRREPRLNDYDQTYSGSGINRMILKQYPLQAVSLVAINDVTVPASSIRFDEHTLFLTDRVFSAGISNIRVVYSAGESPTPDDLVEAYLNIVKAFWLGRPENPNSVTSEIIGVSQDQWTPDGPGSIPPNAVAMLRRFRNEA